MENEETHSKEEQIENYNHFKEKYGLPEFNSLVEDFDVEKALEKESNLILREVRRAISEKISAYTHLLENLLNPASPPLFIFTILKNATSEDKKKVKEIYTKLSKSHLKTMKLDTIYDEEKEANYIKEISEEWQPLKKEIYNLLESFDKEFPEDIDSNTRAYFG